MKEKIGKIFLVIIIIIIVSLFYFLRIGSPPKVPVDNLEALALCLSEKGAKFYGAFWCSHCNSQKKAFGEAAKFLPYVECSESDGKTQTTVCKANNIASYPTWVFADGSRVSGEQSFAFLADKTGCVLE